MEYVKIELDRWENVTDENRELNERFAALKEGGSLIRKGGFFSYWAISFKKIDDIIADENARLIEQLNSTMEKELETLSELKSMSWWQFRKWKRKN